MPKSVLTALIAVQVLFGMNYVISKFVVDAFPPLVWASIRIVIAALVLLVYALITRRPHPTPNREFFVPLIGFSLLGVIINQGSFLIGLHYTTSTNSAVLNTLIPVFTLLIVTLRGQERLTLSRVLGFLFALSGVLVLRKVEDLSFSNQTVIGDLLTILNCLSYGIFLSVGKNFFSRHDPFWSTTWMFIYGSVGLTLLAMPQWMTFHWPAVSTSLFYCMIFAVLGGTLATYFLNNWALSRANSSSVALFIYLQPVVAAVLAWAWLGQAITVRTVLSTVLIFMGMFLALLPRLAPEWDAKLSGKTK